MSEFSDISTRDYFNVEVSQKYDDCFFEILSQIESAINATRVESDQIQNRHESTNAKIKLPQLQSPTFSGKYIDWTSFWDQFTALIDSHPDLHSVQKLQYLQAALQNCPNNVIRHLPISEDNYQLAKELLIQKFANRRAIFSDTMNRLLTIPRNKKDTINNLQSLTTVISESKQTLKTIGVDQIETILAYLIIDKFPPEIRKEFERKAAEKEELPTIEDVISQIQCSLRTLESIESSSTQQLPNDFQSSSKGKVKSLVIAKKTQPERNSIHENHKKEESSIETSKFYECQHCHQQHSIRNCPEFLQLAVDDRRSKAEGYKLCYNCLSGTHTRLKCPSKIGCRKCGRKHHTLLHKENYNQPTVDSTVATTSQGIHTTMLEIPLFHSTLLSTAIIKIQSHNGTWIEFRALIDQGGEASVISENARQILRLKKTRCHIDVTHLNEAQSQSSSFVHIILQSCYNQFTMNTQALVMKSLISRLPSKEIHHSNWSHINGLNLADPSFNKIGSIDIILGAEVYAEIVLPEIRRGIQGTPTAQNTQLGWILFGKAFNQPIESPVSILSSSIEELMEKFMALEDVNQRSHFTQDEQYCIDFFKQTTTRDENGLFIIRFPFRTPFDPTAILGRSRPTALRQFLQLERKFARDPEFKRNYVKNINDFLESGHLTEVHDVEENHQFTTNEGVIGYNCFYLPHHPVINIASTSTPVRIVFNASKPSSNGKSLNDIVFQGPTLLNDLIVILLNWRCHRIAFIADIQKMYRQIRVHPDDMMYQIILWRENSWEPIKEYAINRLGFGLNYGPSAAIQSLHSLADENEAEFPVAAKTLKKCSYMDDLSSGSSDVTSALRLQRDLIQITNSANFLLKKWVSNDEQILLAVPEADRQSAVPLSLNPDKTVKMLGIHWNSSSDTLNFSINFHKIDSISKRSILSSIAKIYDPLGLLSPIIIKAKIFLKKLWIAKLDWDVPLSNELIQEWNHLVSSFRDIPNLYIPRWIGTLPNLSLIEYHGFCDATFEAYGAVIYLRFKDDQGNLSSSIIFSKSKITPIQIQTIARLELAAAVLLSRMMRYVSSSINVYNIESAKKFYWSDSEIVLHWIRGDPNKWKIFVANRITKIQEISDVNAWNYVNTKKNPADLVSRGSTPKRLNEFWFNGPSWLTNNENHFKSSESEIDETTIEDEFKLKVHVTIPTQTPEEKLLNYCSSLRKLLRFTCWFKRFYHYLRNKSTTKKGPITAEEITNATESWILFIQNQAFKTEIEDIKQRKIKSKNRLRKLSPFLDESQILRVGGRLLFAEIPYDEKHPIILPREHQFTRLLIIQTHLETLHGGTQITLAQLRKTFWILKGRTIIRNVISHCIPCHRAKGQTASQMMANLPISRVTPKRAFLHTGVDLCGPVWIRTSKARGSKVYKGYVALFICMTVKAVHIELVLDLSTESFLMAFQRFVARRGLCSDLFCDCGTNFIGARKVLNQDEMDYLKNIHHDLVDTFATKGVRFHFNPPSAPSFGGLWESNIRRIKHHLKRAIGDKSLIHDHLVTVLCRIEAILNSRPLVPMTDEPEDFSYITPGHFLIQDSLLSPPEPSVLNEPIKITHQYKLMLKRVQTFWNLWHRDYLQSLQSRPKWFQQKQNLKPGDVVLIKDERLPPLKWMMGRVVETHPGIDGLVRVCSVKTQNGILKRPIVKLSPLPIEEHQILHELIHLDRENIQYKQNIIMLPLTITKKYFTILIEGNIGVGKSTFLDYLNRVITFDLFSEPVSTWTNLDGHNLLQMLYDNPREWLFTFQSFATLTLIKNHCQSTPKKFKVMERSIFSSKFCFFEAALINQNIHPVQYSILHEWINFLEESHPIDVDLIIYLRCPPEVCLERIKRRNRPEECNINLNYLQLLHRLHNEWLIEKRKTVPAEVIILDTNKDKNQLFDEYQNIIQQITQLLK